ncbi:Oxidoreductase [Zalerion maritima]|uniref:Oxidoreductase n=1 Tax=Zalerion maritima TaxID=339359 RepID=A0AAD5RUM2_9PEZI|nr:Oxidoreductase [Zalerion maritima]
MATTQSKAAYEQTTDELLGQIVKTLDGSEKYRQHLPGLRELLQDYLDDEVELYDVEFHRRMLRVFRDAPKDDTYQKMLGDMEGDEKTRVEKFVADDDKASPEELGKGFEKRFSLGVREHLKAMLEKDAVVVSSSGPVHVAGLSNDELEKKDKILHRFVHGLAGVFSCFGSRVDEAIFKDEVFVYRELEFENWGLNIKSMPAFTCIPSTVAGVRRIVKYAKKTGLGVRCSGFRHSWAPVFGRNGHVMISLLGLHEATKIPNTTAWSFLPQDEPTELESIDVVGPAETKGNTLVRVGVSATNERLRRWCNDNKKYTLPLNVIMVEMTIGGTNGPICHGSGRAHPTLSDLVRKVEYVDANGEFRVVDKPEHLNAASGCFGLLGVITHLTLELSPMTYALIAPAKIPTIRAIPPPPDMREEDIPPALRLKTPLTEEEKREDQKRFEKSAMSDFYCEWFWFPLSDMCWVNCWNDTTDPLGVEDYPTPGAIFFNFIAQFTMNVLQFAPALGEIIDLLDANEIVTVLIARAALIALPNKPVKTYLPEALHFQRGIQNVRVLNMEVEMPLAPSKADPKVPDWAIVQRAWWDAILTCYRHIDTCPQRMPLEMRIMGGSDVIMAPQRGNSLGTCSVEILTLQSRKEEWVPYAQEILDKWLSYRDHAGNKLKTRPHWAKQWQEFKADGKPWAEKLRSEDYKEEIVEFREALAKIGKEHGWKLDDLKERFSNDFLDWFYFEGASAATLRK